MKLRSILLPSLLVLQLFVLSSCKKDVDLSGKGSITFHFEAKFKDQPMVFGKAYTNAQGDVIWFKAFRYYVSNIMLSGPEQGIYVAPESYFLVDHGVSGKDQFTLKDVPGGKYNKLYLMIGVDSTHNVSGAQAGALDPVNQMFWTWNSGYIFMKVEGNYGADGLKEFYYHIGGFKPPFAANPYLEIDLAETLTVKNGTSPTIHIKADLAKLFDGPNPLSPQTTYKIHAPGEAAYKASGNFASVFTFDHIHTSF